MAGLADAEGHLTKTYQYGVTGELTYGSATYENEYTYNGESYNPNIQSQYLRARYYNVVTANFFTGDSYLGNINQPLTLNRYNYCISSYLNYVDPNGNEKIVISGGIDDNAKHKYQFIETALLDINNLIKKKTPTSEIRGLGYSELGSLKYPCITPLGGDLDTLLDGGIWERGWTLFEPQK